MKRDMELIRKLLFFFEKKPGVGCILLKDLKIDGYDFYEIGHHINLLYESGFLSGEPTTTKNGRVISVIPFNLTWSGHEFLDSIREDSVWRKIKSIGGKFSQSLTVEAIKTITLHILNNSLNSLGSIS